MVETFTRFNTNFQLSFLLVTLLTKDDGWEEDGWKNDEWTDDGWTDDGWTDGDGVSMQYHSCNILLGVNNSWYSSFTFTIVFSQECTSNEHRLCCDENPPPGYSPRRFCRLIGCNLDHC